MPLVIRFLIDENAPTYSLRSFLESRGHEVLLVGEVFPKSSPDQLLLAASEIEGLVIVTFDRDFRSLIQQLPSGTKSGVRKRAGRVSLTLKNATLVLPRIRETIDLLEFQYERSMSRNQRFIMQLSESSVTFAERSPEE